MTLNLARELEFKLGALRVVPAELVVEAHGERRELQPRVMQVLVALARARPRTVSRDQFAEQCWGGLVVGDDALNRCILALRNLAKGLSPEPFTIETVPRIGHRLIESGQTARRRRPNAIVYAGLAAVVLIGALVVGVSWESLRVHERGPAAIAVLPFRSLSDGDTFMAEGIGEEVLDRLADEPAFRVAGRTSAARYRNATDLRELGQALHVDYVLEGTVRTEPGRVRVHASLVRTRDGMRIWSETYDRKLDDLFAIQDAIGKSVAEALSRKLATRASHTESAVQGEAYRDYLEARGMLRIFNPEFGEMAVALLRRAVAADPNYAAAWSSLAEAIRLDATLKGHERVIASLPEAQDDARRAIAIAPDLAEAHGHLGVLLGYDTDEAQAELRKAAALEPHNAEAQIWLAAAARVSGDFEDEIAADRRAAALDPDWYRPHRDLAFALAEMGDRAGGEREASRAGTSDRTIPVGVMSRIDWLYGDFADAAQRWSAVADGRDSIWQAPARIALANARFTLALPGAQPPPSPPPMAEMRSNLGRFWMAAAPSPEVWRQRNRNAAAALVYHEENMVGAKLMLATGRGGELVQGYDGPMGLLGLRSGVPIEPKDLHAAALVALALRQAGRESETKALLDQAQSQVERVYRRGRTPCTFDVDAAEIAAVGGRRELALDTLQRAVRRGWAHSAPDDLLRLQDEPAFASLKHDRRFVTITASFDARLARERAKAIKLGL